MHLLVSEWIRTKRTAIRWLTFFMPIVVAACAVAYLALRTGSTQAFAFEGFYSIWTAFIIPVGVGILAGDIVHEEELAGNFSGFLGSGLSRTKLYLGKFLLLVFCSTVCTFIAAFILYLGLKFVVLETASAAIFLGSAVLTAIGTLPLLAIHLWISFAWGMGASVGISFGGILMAVIFGTTSLGEHLWMFVPWTWPVKLGMLPGTYFIKDSSMFSSSEIIANVTQTASLGLLVTVVALVLFLLGGIIWFQKWENQKGAE